MASWLHSLPSSENGRIKSPRRYLDFLNRTTFSEVVECVFGFTEKCFRVARNDLNNVQMKGLGSKPLRIHLEFAKAIYMYIRLMIEKNVVLMIFYIVYDAKYVKGKSPTSMLALLLFGIF